MYHRGVDGPMDDDDISDWVTFCCLLAIIFFQMAVLGSPRQEAQKETQNAPSVELHTSAE